MSRRDALVLVADDDNSSSSAIEKMLAKDGHRCLRARNGQEALRLFWDERPDLIILDVMMPLLDGFQVCERIREHDRATPVLFLTAKGDIVDKRIGYGIGGDDYLGGFGSLCDKGLA
jgi:two-component system alkaline phosphatase synthesis response regulator PhoP